MAVGTFWATQLGFQYILYFTGWIIIWLKRQRQTFSYLGVIILDSLWLFTRKFCIDFFVLFAIKTHVFGNNNLFQD